MPLSLDKANTVARGHFNPHIIHPLWLAQQEVWDQLDTEVAFGALTRGLAFRGKDIEWEVDFDHLIVSSLVHDCGAIVGRVLTKLPHTPIRAIGNNFTYGASLEEWDPDFVPTLGGRGPSEFEQIGNPDQVRWSGTFTRQDSQVEVSVAYGLGGVAVLFNHHRPISTPEQAVAAANEFSRDKAASEHLLRNLFAQEVTV